jgi:hypothetical protein
MLTPTSGERRSTTEARGDCFGQSRTARDQHQPANSRAIAVLATTAGLWRASKPAHRACRQHRQGVISVLSLIGRRVSFQSICPTPEVFKASPVPYAGIEWRQKADLLWRVVRFNERHVSGPYGSMLRRNGRFVNFDSFVTVGYPGPAHSAALAEHELLPLKFHPNHSLRVSGRNESPSLVGAWVHSRAPSQEPL